MICTLLLSACNDDCTVVSFVVITKHESCTLMTAGESASLASSARTADHTHASDATQ